MGFLSSISERKGSIIWFLVLLAAGIAVSFYLVPREIAQLNWEVPGSPEEYPFVYKLRPYLIIVACFLPALGALIMCFVQTMDRYMARNQLATFAMTTGIIFLIWLLADFSDNVSDITSMDSPVKGMFRFYGNQIPMVFSLIVPYSLLLATLWTLSTLSRNCEITSMIQSGRSILRITTPLIVIGLFVAAFITIFNYQWAPSATLYRRLTFDDISRTKNIREKRAVDPIIYRNDIDNRIWRIALFPPLEKPTEPFRIVHIAEFSAPGKLSTEYFADEARWNAVDRTWTLKNVRTRIHPQEEEDIPYYEPERENLTLPYKETPWLLITPGIRLDSRSIPDIMSHLEDHSLNAKDRLQFRTHKYLRFAQGFSSLILVLLAIPGGISFSRRGSLSGVGIALGLSGCMIFGYEVFPALSSAGYIPPFLGAWLPDIIFFFIAVYLFQTRLAMRRLSDFMPLLRSRKQ